MPNARLALLIALALFTLTYFVAWYWLVRHPVHRALRPTEDQGAPTGHSLWIGAVTNFFDTLGIGSFAPTTSLFRIFKVVPDERIRFAPSIFMPSQASLPRWCWQAGLSRSHEPSVSW